MVEATAVEPRGRISPQDMGLWDDKHIEGLASITGFLHDQGAISGIQLAHAGRKACTRRPWDGGQPIKRDEGAWQPVGPSAIPFSEGYQVPHELSESEIADIVEEFRKATHRACVAGFKLIEVHAAHGYLLHSFLSPLSNKRTDKYGGSLENRMRLPLQVATVVRKEIPDHMPLFMRISASDWAEGGWDLDQSVSLAKKLSRAGVDLVDCSSGGLAAHAKIEAGPGYQVPFADTVKREAAIKTAAVGMITSPKQADEIIKSGKADLVFLARELLRDPYWPMHAAKELDCKVEWPQQYSRAQT
jgi:2,4-dienoyl-CoA reductase-like NADH-dependent reductase (Old Yellow Enzyme family)